MKAHAGDERAAAKCTQRPAVVKTNSVSHSLVKKEARLYTRGQIAAAEGLVRVDVAKSRRLCEICFFFKSYNSLLSTSNRLQNAKS